MVLRTEKEVRESLVVNEKLREICTLPEAMSNYDLSIYWLKWMLKEVD